MTLMGDTTTDPAPEYAHNPQNIFLLDVFLGIVCVVFISVGIPGNLILFRHFLKQKKDLRTILYLLISFNDLLTTTTAFPSAVSFIDHREAHLFGITMFCQSWGLVWTIIPFISVFLVSVLSITRTIVLINPLVVINRKFVLGMIGVYYFYIVLRVLVPLLAGEIHFIYSRADLYCWDGGTESESNWYFYYDIATGVLQLAAPIIPIFISCLVSTITLLRSNSRVLGETFGFSKSSLKKRPTSPKLYATVTIILVTTMYIIFNIPIFAAWCKYLADGLTVDETDLFAFWYLWSSTYILCTAGNAAVNPLLLYWRNRKFRDFVTVRTLSKTGIKQGFCTQPSTGRGVSYFRGPAIEVQECDVNSNKTDFNSNQVNCTV
ncbi:tachykinin-like peptides receptor 86C [Bolinopsis microptera]|uniref:tachykinin-like peptides receptor 86C n=1 Tax=Bolinopsis microptera TaxID=2820187 RepID=UPI003078B0AA